mgnify:CR=1 FL=1
MPEEVRKVSPQVLAKIQAMQTAFQQQIQIYLAGVQDSMGLDGQYNINMQTGELTKVLPPAPIVEVKKEKS